MNSFERTNAIRSSCGLFRRLDRGLLEVSGGDRTRWLNSMLSNDISRLATEGPQSFCYATALTNKGMIVADFHVLARPSSFWLETDRAVLPRVKEHLTKFIIADDVVLKDVGDYVERWALEGPATARILSSMAGQPVELGEGMACELHIAEVMVLVASFGVTGESAAQLYIPSEWAEPVVEELRAEGRNHGLVEGDPESLNILRVEAGVPALETELLPNVLPQEARLERIISTSKGCYVGQEIMARLAARGHVNNLLVGLVVEGGDESVLCPGETILHEAQAIGEVTSAVISARLGSIALGYVKAKVAGEGMRLVVGGRDVVVKRLPFPAVGVE